MESTGVVVQVVDVGMAGLAPRARVHSVAQLARPAVGYARGNEGGVRGRGEHGLGGEDTRELALLGCCRRTHHAGLGRTHQPEVKRRANGGQGH